MPMLNFFALAEEEADRARREITDTLRPAHSVITKFIRKQEYNVVVQLPSDQITNVMKADILHTYREKLKQTGVWGLKLKMEPSLGEDYLGIEGNYTWIKKSVVWWRMLQIAGDQAEIGFKEEKEQNETLFVVADSSQVGRTIGRVLEGEEILLCAIGPSAQHALQAAIIQEREFDCKNWDCDGYFQGPEITREEFLKKIALGLKPNNYNGGKT